MKQINIYAENLEASALEQFESAMDQEFSIKGALMPDAHTGYSLPIGAVVATDSVVLPSWVGYDIGCGMCAISTTFSRTEVECFSGEIFKALYKNIPVGFNHHKADKAWSHSHIACTPQMEEIFAKNGLRQVGTLGGGNHFIEIGYDECDDVWIIIHSGSRGIGHTVATQYMRAASMTGKASEGHFGFNTKSAHGIAYIMDLNFCLEFALENRRQLIFATIATMQEYIDGIGDLTTFINRNHNHAEEKDGLWIHRKGATHAEKNMLGVIPGNMRDGSFIVNGKGNPDALWSSSHGAGRVMGRKVAKQTLDINVFKEQLIGVVAKVEESTLDEAPDAYKNIFDVMEAQKDMVDIIHHVKPIINIKG